MLVMVLWVYYMIALNRIFSKVMNPIYIGVKSKISVWGACSIFGAIMAGIIGSHPIIGIVLAVVTGVIAFS